MSRSTSTAKGWFAIRRPLRVTTYSVRDERWTCPPLKIAVLADLHVGTPWLTPEELERIVVQTNGLGADLILVPGDLLLDRNMWWFSGFVPPRPIVERLAKLRAPLGVFSILGNHDWTDCDLARSTNFARNSVIDAYAQIGLPLLVNRAAELSHRGKRFWLVGTDSQRPRSFQNPRRRINRLDVDAAFSDVPPGSPAIHLAHEPDYFAHGDSRAFLQISGHTHGGQIKIFGHTPHVPSLYGSRYASGHIQENGNHLIVSNGVGYSGVPLRIGVPPEIVIVNVGIEEEERPHG